MEKCKICGKEYNGVLGLPGHLRHNHIDYNVQKYYDEFYKKEDEGICPICGKPTKFRNFTYGYNKYCSSQCVQNSKEVKEKREQTWLEKYGVNNPSKSKEIHNKTRQTCINKYNGIGYASKELNEKSQTTMLQKYNVKYGLQNKESKEKLKQTKLDKYGDETYNNSNKMIETRYEKINQLENQGYTLQNTLVQLYGQGWLNIKDSLDYKIENNFVLINNKDIPKIIDYCNINHHAVSNKEKEIVDYIKSIYSGNIIENSRIVINPYELDIYLPEINSAIEFNGLYYHSIEIGTPKEYHLTKSLMCRKKGIRLIHIYEFEDLEEQKQLLKDLILGIDNYPKNDFNKNNLLTKIPKPKCIYKDNYTIFGAGKLY